jgi:lysophospholipase L1-like esterase
MKRPGGALRTTTLAALVPALLASLLVVAAPSASAATVLDSTTDACLRAASNDPGGTLVLTDTRLSAYEASRLAATMRGFGRQTCVRRDRTFTVAKAYAWWAGLPEYRRPDTVVLAVPGTYSQFTLWAKTMPFRRLLGTVDSGISPGSRLTLWPRGANGTTAGRAILSRLGELMVNAHAWAGTRESWLLTSSSAQCAAAVASPKGVLLLGDSITSHDFANAAPALAARGYVPCVYAQSSSRIYEHLARIVAGKVPLPKNIIVALGNNDIFTGYGGYPFKFRAQVVALMRQLKGHNVVFPTVWRTKNQTFLRALQHNCTVANTVIRSVAKDQPTWRTPDWAAVVKAHPAIQFDGIHLTSSGLRLRYDMFAAALDELNAPA